MERKDILAIIVSYNGLEKPVEAVKALSGKVGHIHVVDNASDAPSLDHLHRLETTPDLSFTWLPENLGIGHALNIGIARAQMLGCKWLLTMDQDSRVGEYMIEAYLRAAEANINNVCLSPRMVGNEIWPDGKNGEVAFAITSGNLVKLEVFDTIGQYNSDMFIDCIDLDFSLRVRSAGWGIFRVKDAVLHHQLGEPHKIIWPLKRFYSRHPPIRRYYMYRNFCLLARMHFWRFPMFIIKSTVCHLILLVLIPFFDKHPAKSMFAIICGISDYLSGRFGKCTRGI